MAGDRSVWTGVRSRRVWCALLEREVLVTFEERGLPGFRSPVAVRTCSAFDPPSAVACHRRCVDSTFRRQWPWALPIED